MCMYFLTCTVDIRFNYCDRRCGVTVEFMKIRYKQVEAWPFFILVISVLDLVMMKRSSMLTFALSNY